MKHCCSSLKHRHQKVRGFSDLETYWAMGIFTLLIGLLIRTLNIYVGLKSGHSLVWKYDICLALFALLGTGLITSLVKTCHKQCEKCDQKQLPSWEIAQNICGFLMIPAVILLWIFGTILLGNILGHLLFYITSAKMS
jgi:hypothetical protein